MAGADTMAVWLREEARQTPREVIDGWAERGIRLQTLAQHLREHFGDAPVGSDGLRAALQLLVLLLPVSPSSASKGTSPVVASKSTAPMPHTSAAGLRWSPRACSGDI